MGIRDRMAVMTYPPDKPFWQRPLQQLSAEEWEQLCDGCGRCCLHKLEDEDSGEVYYTRIACSWLDIPSCRCTAYATRAAAEPECVILTRENLSELDYLPETCAYRLRSEGKPLPAWHPLVSGDSQGAHTAGVSVRAFALPLREVEDPDDLEDYVIDPA